MTHPLEPLTAAELETAAKLYRREVNGTLGDAAADGLFSTIVLEEPTRAELAAYADGAGTPIDRRARVWAIGGPDVLVEAIANLTHDRLDRVTPLDGAKPPMLFDEIINAAEALKSDERWIAALAKRGVEDLETVQMDPWPPGTFQHPFESGRRMTKVIPYLRHFPTDNGYAHPIENVAGYVDTFTYEVLHVEDGDVVPVPQECRNYDVESVGPARTDLRDLQIVQPDGVSFTVEGNLIRWQRWQLRVSMQPVEGLVLHDVRYTDGDRVRPILHRASIAEMVVPYGSTQSSQNWKNAFDMGEWGVGRFANSLELGCDCLGEIHYFSDDVLDEYGNASTRPNVICLHEEDYGILWTHQDLHTFEKESRRSRRLVVSSIHTVGNYEYGFYWHFYLDGSIELMVKLTGIVQPQAVAPGGEPGNANWIGDGLAAPHHQHLFCARLDVSVDGPANTVHEVDVVPVAAGADNPNHNGFTTQDTALRTEAEAQRLIDPARSRTWRIVNEHETNRWGQPVSYKLLPHPSPTLLAAPEAMVHQRAGFATRNLWVTPYDPSERRPAGDFPGQSRGGDGLPAWTAANRPVEDTEIVVWHTFGVTHVVRPEDFPVMPVEYCGFWLQPFGFFDQNPALDIPETTADRCH
jgi:primary-amine oxidase